MLLRAQVLALGPGVRIQAPESARDRLREKLLRREFQDVLDPQHLIRLLQRIHQNMFG